MDAAARGLDLSAVIDAVAQPGQEHPVDLSQAYFVYKPVPHSQTRFSVRGGLFYPPISLENDGRAWTVTDTITPSAIDSWVGEEVKVVGLEGSVSTELGDQTVKATAAVFGYDDTSGTLLAFRGWALHDIQSQANGSFPLPPRSPFLDAVIQSDDTYSTLEIDHRAGFYGRFEWDPGSPLTLHAFLLRQRRRPGQRHPPDLHGPGPPGSGKRRRALGPRRADQAAGAGPARHDRDGVREPGGRPGRHG